VQLIDARTGFHMWTETYDRPLTELFAVQEAIASEIVNALAVRLTGTEKDALYRGGTRTWRRTTCTCSRGRSGSRGRFHD